MGKPYTKSNIFGIFGIKRAGKSLLLARAIVMKLIEGETVWSNMPVKVSDDIMKMRWSPGGRRITYAESKPIDWELLYRLDDSIVEGTVAVDEIGYVDGARQSMSTKNRLINGCIRQVGHRSLDFYYTAKGFTRADYYMRDETDVAAVCKDLTYQPWGRQNNVPGGTMINVKYFDISGTATGRSIYATPFAKNWEFSGYGCFGEENLYGTLFHGCYDTKRIVSIEEAFTGVEVDFKKRRISNDKEINSWIAEKIYQAVKVFKNSGQIQVPTYTFWEYVKSNMGLDGASNQLSRYLPNGVRRYATSNGRMYDFAKVEV